MNVEDIEATLLSFSIDMHSNNSIILACLLPKILKFRKQLENDGQLDQFKSEIDELARDVSNKCKEQLKKY